jgi:cobalamin biosynthesis protein CobD/CbiB
LLNDHGIYCAIAEHLADELGRWLLGPLFWYLLLGAAEIAALRGHHASSRSLRHDDETRAGFGWMAYRLEMLAGIIPGWISGYLFVVASLLAPTARPSGRGVSCMQRRERFLLP